MKAIQCLMKPVVSLPNGNEPRCPGGPYPVDDAVQVVGHVLLPAGQRLLHSGQQLAVSSQLQQLLSGPGAGLQPRQRRQRQEQPRAQLLPRPDSAAYSQQHPPADHRPYSSGQKQVYMLSTFTTVLSSRSRKTSTPISIENLSPRSLPVAFILHWYRKCS